MAPKKICERPEFDVGVYILILPEFGMISLFPEKERGLRFGPIKFDVH